MYAEPVPFPCHEFQKAPLLNIITVFHLSKPIVSLKYVFVMEVNIEFIYVSIFFIVTSVNYVILN